MLGCLELGSREEALEKNEDLLVELSRRHQLPSQTLQRETWFNPPLFLKLQGGQVSMAVRRLPLLILLNLEK